MTVKRINYSGRLKLTRDEASVRVWPPTRSTDKACFDVQLDLARLLPSFSDALVFVEAYQRSVRMRFAFGTVANIAEPPPNQRVLSEFPEWQDVQFRIKITDVTASSGRIVAWADRIKPQGLDNGNETDLVRFRDAELRGRLWDVEFDELGPIVLVERDQGGAQSVGRSNYFRAAAYPEILRRVLFQALILDDGSVDDEDYWLKLWYEGFLHSKLKLSEPPDGTTQEKIEWIDDAVVKFASKLQISTLWQNTAEGR